MAQPVVVINNNKNFHSIQFDAAAKASMMVNSLDVKIAGDLSIKGSNSFGFTGAGAKMDFTLLGIAFEADFGESLKLLNSVNLKACTADGKAVLKEADLLLTQVEKIVTASETHATQMKTALTSAKNGTTSVSNHGISLDM